MQTLDELREEILRAACAQEDVVPLVQSVINLYGDHGAESLLSIPEMPEDAAQAQYMITHALERFGIDKYLDMLIRQMPAMAMTCPKYLDFLVRRVLRSPKFGTMLLDRANSSTDSAKQVLGELLESGRHDAKETEAFRDLCRSGLQLLRIC